MFPLLVDFLIVNDTKTKAAASTFVNHIQQLSYYLHHCFNEYFGDDNLSMYAVF